MIKSNLIAEIAAKHPQLSLSDVTLAVNKLIEVMANAITNNERVEIRGFGSFSLHVQPARKVYNPKTREQIITEGNYRPHFKPGKVLRDRVNLSTTDRN